MDRSAAGGPGEAQRDQSRQASPEGGRPDRVRECQDASFPLSLSRESAPAIHYYTTDSALGQSPRGAWGSWPAAAEGLPVPLGGAPGVHFHWSDPHAGV